MWKLTDTLLYKKAKLTNTTSPHSDQIDKETYPTQNSDLIGTKVLVKYTNFYRCNEKEALEEPAVSADGKSLRPHDDNQHLFPIIIPDIDIDSKDFWEEEFTVLRADLDEPNVFIGINEDYSVILVGSTKMNEMFHYDFIDNVYVYPIQKNELYNVRLKTHYMNENYVEDFYRDAILLRIDDCDPAQAILMEYINSNTVRLILSDEIISIDNNEDGYVKNSDIPEYRRNLLEGKTIYGTI